MYISSCTSYQEKWTFYYECDQLLSFNMCQCNYLLGNSFIQSLKNRLFSGSLK